MRSSQLQRTLDHHLGRAILAVVSLFRRRRPLPERADRIVVLQPTAIGDTLVAAGVLRAIRRRYPQAELTVLHGPSNAAALPLLAERFERLQANFTRPWKVIALLRRLRPEVVVDLTPWPRTTALCAQLSGAVAVGYDSTGQDRGLAFDIPVRHLNRHEIENAAAMAAVFDPGCRYVSTVRAPPPAPQGLPYDRLIIFHTLGGGSQRELRMWPAAHWVELARRLGADGYVIGLTGSAAEAEHVDALRREMASVAPEVLDLTGRFGLKELTAVLLNARCLVSVDTGALHLASAVDAPLVSLHGASLSTRWGPWGSRGVGLDSPHPAAGYASFGFETHPQGHEVMPALTVDRVYAAVRDVLESPGAASAKA